MQGAQHFADLGLVELKGFELRLRVCRIYRLCRLYRVHRAYRVHRVVYRAAYKGLQCLKIT